ncbi:E3 ubiquitin-protein ligase RNF34 isoform X2 [Denticeps clupeoides]|uniref:E3 ubiquitin-protein ligase RNF34 isoform X2 n=1 Tax=Denticeps clupeoides TaxID=299321 RepID=UPI0010A3A427|nr:E3 ubiquitin-protein ligase RNF34-like isoform X2 [Denticeps clupeoides]
MKAGASSMWASCCGLLNEVMGTGAVRSQQPGFGPGAGPFRFTPSAGYSTYPPTTTSTTTSGSTGLACKACGLAFSVFRRKHVCSDCKKSFCSLCSVLQEDLRRCATCHLLWGTAFQRPLLMRLRVKDLRQYLTLRNVPTDTCREKEDLVELVLCTLGSREQLAVEEEDEEEEEEDEEEEEEDDDDDNDDEEEIEGQTEEGESDCLQSQPRSLFSAPPSTSVTASQGHALGRTDSSGTGSQDHEDALPFSFLNTEPSERMLEASPVTQRGARASLSDLSAEGDVESLTVRQLKEILARNFVNYSGCCEKWELVERVRRLYREREQNRKSVESGSSITAVVTYPPPICNGDAEDSAKAQLSSMDENLCRICMDAAIDCVLLECGHMVTCTKCGKRMNECPICRQYVVRAVHVFKS